MTPTAQTDPDFVFEGIPPIEEVVTTRALDAQAAAQPADPLGPWPSFLAPGRGTASTPSGGRTIPLAVPATTSPSEPATVVRMASIPHGTVILAQGTTQFLNGGPPHIPDNNIIPFPIGSPPPPNSAFAANEQTFTELNLSIPTTFRFASPGVTQDMVKNPNSVLQTALQGQTITNKTFIIRISTTHNPIKGGGTANTAFLSAAGNPPTGNANAVEVDATFWIETVAGTQGQPDKLQLQCTHSWCSSTSTASAGHTSQLQYFTSNELANAGSKRGLLSRRRSIPAAAASLR